MYRLFLRTVVISVLSVNSTGILIRLKFQGTHIAVEIRIFRNEAGSVIRPTEGYSKRGQVLNVD